MNFYDYSCISLNFMLLFFCLDELFCARSG